MDQDYKFYHFHPLNNIFFTQLFLSFNPKLFEPFKSFRLSTHLVNITIPMWSFVYQNISIIKITTRNRTNPCRIRL
jgi:hypothetical protein